MVSLGAYWDKAERELLQAKAWYAEHREDYMKERERENLPVGHLLDHRYKMQRKEPRVETFDSGMCVYV